MAERTQGIDGKFVRTNFSCTVCGAPAVSRGMCDKHYRRVLKHGSPDVVLDKGPKTKGPANPRWKGADITYSGAHQRVLKVKGPAASYQCVDCGGGALHWSLRNDSAIRQSGEGQHGYLMDYSPDPDDYEPRCVPCHAAYDRGVTATPPTGTLS